MQTSAVQVFLAVINLILCTQRMPCENSLKTCIGSTLAVSILVLEVCLFLAQVTVSKALCAMHQVSRKYAMAHACTGFSQVYRYCASI